MIKYSGYSINSPQDFCFLVINQGGISVHSGKVFLAVFEHIPALLDTFQVHLAAWVWLHWAAQRKTLIVFLKRYTRQAGRVILSEISASSDLTDFSKLCNPQFQCTQISLSLSLCIFLSITSDSLLIKSIHQTKHLKVRTCWICRRNQSIGRLSCCTSYGTDIFTYKYLCPEQMEIFSISFSQTLILEPQLLNSILGICLFFWCSFTH